MPTTNGAVVQLVSQVDVKGEHVLLKMLYLTWISVENALNYKRVLAFRYNIHSFAILCSYNAKCLAIYVATAVVYLLF